jgi:hypothetical protein
MKKREKCLGGVGSRERREGEQSFVTKKRAERAKAVIGAVLQRGVVFVGV